MISFSGATPADVEQFLILERCISSKVHFCLHITSQYSRLLFQCVTGAARRQRPNKIIRLFRLYSAPQRSAHGLWISETMEAYG